MKLESVVKYYSILNSLLLIVISLIQIISSNCIESNVIVFLSGIILSILEWPMFMRLCSSKCSKLHNQLQNKATYLAKGISYTLLSIGIACTYMINRYCWGSIIFGITIGINGVLYSYYFYKEYNDAKLGKYDTKKLDKLFSTLSNV